MGCSSSVRHSHDRRRRRTYSGQAEPTAASGQVSTQFAKPEYGIIILGFTVNTVKPLVHRYKKYIKEETKAID